MHENRNGWGLGVGENLAGCLGLTEKETEETVYNRLRMYIPSNNIFAFKLLYGASLPQDLINTTTHCEVLQYQAHVRLSPKHD